MSARRRRVLVDIGGSSAEARRAVREVRDDLRRLSREEVTARIDVNERVVLAKIEKVQERLRKLSAQEPSVKVDMQVAGAYAQLDRLNLRLDKLKLKRVNIDVDVKRGALERTVAGLGAVERGVDKAGKRFGGLFNSIPVIGSAIEGALSGVFALFNSLGNTVGTVISSAVRGLSQMVGTSGALAGPLGSIAGSFVSLGLSLAGLTVIAGAAVIALNAILGAIIALGGALVALVASAAAAAAGLGALAVAFGAVLIPVAIVAFGVFQRFQAILKAHQAQQQAVAQATQAAKTAEQAHTAALQERQRAEQQLAQATVQGRQAAAQAIRDETDAELGLRNAKAGVQDSRLQLALAKRDLREFLAQAGASGPKLSELVKQFSDVDFNPAKGRSIFKQATGGKGIDPLDLRQKIQAVKDAQLGVANATNQVTHAEVTLAQARQKEADFTRRGLKAFGPYRQALEAVAKANQHVARSVDQTSAAQRKYAQALKGLSGTEQGTLSRFDQLSAGFKRLAKAFTDPVFRALNDTFDKLSGHAGDFTGVLTKLGGAFGDVIRAIGSFLTEPRTLSAFKTMAGGAADLVHQLGARAFVSFLRIMREIATSALPAVRNAAKGVADWLGRIAGKPASIHSAVKKVVDQFRAWARLAGALGNLVAQIFIAAAPAGKSLATSLTTWANEQARLIKQNPGPIRKFFHDAVQKTKDIVHWLKEAFLWLKNNLPKAAASTKAAFETVVPVLKQILSLVKSWNKLQGGISKLVMPLSPHGSSGGIGKQKPIPPGWDYDLTTKQWFHNHKLSRNPPPGFAMGGLVPGGGFGDIVPALLEPGEFVLRRAVVQQLSLPVLRALNGGAVPAMAPAGASAGPSVISPVFEIHGEQDPLVLATKTWRHTERIMDQELRRRFG